jgi:hypothetical protein
MWEIRYVYKIFVGKPEVKRELGTPRHRWEDDTKINLDIWSEDVDLIHAAQNKDHGGS